MHRDRGPEPGVVGIAEFSGKLKKGADRSGRA